MDGIPTEENQTEAVEIQHQSHLHASSSFSDGCDAGSKCDALFSVLSNLVLLLTSTLHHFVEFALDVELWVFGFHTF